MPLAPVQYRYAQFVEGTMMIVPWGILSFPRSGLLLPRARAEQRSAERAKGQSPKPLFSEMGRRCEKRWNGAIDPQLLRNATICTPNMQGRCCHEFKRCYLRECRVLSSRKPQHQMRCTSSRGVFTIRTAALLPLQRSFFCVRPSLAERGANATESSLNRKTGDDIGRGSRIVVPYPPPSGIAVERAADVGAFLEIG